MILRSEIIQKWWPTTQSLDLVEGSVENVAASVHQELIGFLHGEALTTTWEAFPDLDAAFNVATEFTNVPTIFLVIPTNTRWTVLWNNSFLCDGYDSLCWCLTKKHSLTTIHWSAHDERTSFQSGASFVHRRNVKGEVLERSVSVAQEDKRWLFIEYGEPLVEEDLESYKLRRKRDRLNEEKVSDLLSRLGASPWLEQFYAIPDIRTFVVRRVKPPSTICRRTLVDVINQGQQSLPIDDSTSDPCENIPMGHDPEMWRKHYKCP